MPRRVVKYALPGYRADTDNNPDHFSLFVDDDSSEEIVLIKEKERNTVSIAGHSSATITHNLGYVPLVFVFGEIDANTWGYVMGDSADIEYSIEVTTTTVKIWNNSAVQKDFKYYIFYDQQV